MIAKFGQLFSMGSNEHGQLGTNDIEGLSKDTPQLISQITDPIQVCCGAESSYALAQDGALFSWGCNEQAQLGYKSVNVFAPRKVPFNKAISSISVGDTHCAVIASTSDLVFTWGSNSMG